MKKNNHNANGSSALRKRAEDQIDAEHRTPGKASDFAAVLHELRVHQVELEMQNEQLRASQHELETSRNRYANLYDYAPNGYVTLDAAGVVREINLTAASWLNLERERVLDRPFIHFLVPETRPALLDHLKIMAREHVEFDVALSVKGGESRSVQLIAAPAREPDRDGPVIRVAIMDITRRAAAERALYESHNELEARVQQRTAELQQVNQALKAEEEKYRRLFETISDAVVLMDVDTRRIVAANEAAVRLYGYTREEFTGLPFDQISAIPQSPDDLMHDVAEDQPARAILGAHRGKNGAVFPVEISTGTFTHDGRRVVCKAIRDITARRRSEERIQKLSRVESVVAAVNHAIARVFERGELLECVCRAVIEKGALKLAWIGMVQPDGTVRPVAGAGQTDYLTNLQIAVSDQSPRQPDPVSTAIRENRRVMIQDTENEPHLAAWSDRARQFGLRHVASFPLHIDNRCVGAFTAYAATADILDETEVQMLGQIAGDVSFALTSISRNEERTHAEEQLLLRDSALAAAANGIYIVNNLGAIIWVNESFTRITGYTRDEAIGQNPRIMKSGRQSVDFYQELWGTILAGHDWHGEIINRHKTGRHYILDLTITPVRDRSGRVAYFIAIQQDITDRKELEQSMLTAVEREQQRIGRDLHDGLCQILTGAKFRTGLLGQKIHAWSPLAETNETATIELLLDQAIAQARDIAHGLYPVQDKPDGLMRALEELAASIDNESGPRCVCHIPRPVLVENRGAALHLYRIAQEAVQNALKHAAAKKITIELASNASGLLRLSVNDDGDGVLPGALGNNGAGLSNMNMRAQTIGGRLNIRSVPECGTSIECILQLPVPAPENQP